MVKPQVPGDGFRLQAPPMTCGRWTGKPEAGVQPHKTDNH